MGDTIQPIRVMLRVDQSWSTFFRDFFFSVFSYVKGIYSFGLMETNFYDQAEKLAKEVSGPSQGADPQGVVSGGMEHMRATTHW